MGTDPVDKWWKEIFIPWVEDADGGNDVLLGWLADDTLSVDKLRYGKSHPEFLELDYIKEEYAGSLITDAIKTFYINREANHQYWLTFWREKFSSKLHQALVTIPSLAQKKRRAYIVPQLLEMARVLHGKIRISEESFGVLARLMDCEEVKRLYEYQLLSCLAEIQTDRRLLPLWRSMLVERKFPCESYARWRRRMQAAHRKEQKQFPGMRVLDDHATYLQMVEMMAIRGIAIVYERIARLGGRGVEVITDIAGEIEIAVMQNANPAHIFSTLAGIFPASYLGGEFVDRTSDTMRSRFYEELKQYGSEHAWPQPALDEIKQHCEYVIVDY